MRKLGLSLLLTSMVLVPYAALSRRSQARPPTIMSAGLTGECAEAATPKRHRPGRSRPSSPRPVASRVATTPAPKAPPRPKQTASRPAQRPVQRPAQPGRVDLRLAFGNGSAVVSPRRTSPRLRRGAAPAAARQPGPDRGSYRFLGRPLDQHEPVAARRAQAAVDYLASQGIAANRLEVRGYGFDRPLPGKNASAPENRRVEAARIS